MARYRQETTVDGRWSRQVQPVMRDVQPYRMACCDCGLVHDIEFWVENGHVQMRLARNLRATGQKRRHMKAHAAQAREEISRSREEISR